MSEHAGHRQRIIDKLRHGALCEHEWLELLLFNAIPRRNTNDLAHRLLSEFGSVVGIVSAPIERLEKVEGIGASVAAYLHAFGLLCNAYVDKVDVERTFPEIYEDESFRHFLERRYRGKKEELMDVYCLDESGKIYLCKSFTLGQSEAVSVDMEELNAFLSSNTPSGLVLAHNHPFGNCKPSTTDDKATLKLKELCLTHDVRFYDHYVFAHDGIYSYYHDDNLLLEEEK